MDTSHGLQVGTSSVDSYILPPQFIYLVRLPWVPSNLMYILQPADQLSFLTGKSVVLQICEGLD